MNGYPTDEELELLISQLEEQKLYAPKHMKEQILSQAFPKQTVEIFPQTGRSSHRAQNFAYRIKIIAGMAAALFMLMIIPMQNEEQRDWDGPDSGSREQKMEQELEREKQTQEETYPVNVNAVFNENWWKMNQRINLWFEQAGNLEIENYFD